VPVQVPLVADCAQAVQGLLELARQKGEGRDFAAEHASWITRLRTIRRECPLSYQKNGDIKPQAVIEALNEITRGEVLITTDVGQHQMWAGQFFTYTRPRTFLSSGGLGTMGFGVPAAIGAQMAEPDSLVVAITGDGSFQMNLQELGTIMENKLPIKILLLNNHALGMVRQWQELLYDKNYVDSVDSLQPDFLLLAGSYGMDGCRITRESELMPELRKALAAPGAALIEVEIARRENVSPIVPPGAALNEMIMM
jgi:acetolactate synthase-1/2/3 large subunit